LKFFLIAVTLTLVALAGLEKIAPAPKEPMYPHIDEKNPAPTERPVLVQFEEPGPLAEKSKPFPIWSGSFCDGG
jgi:hypothetical protein